MKDRNHLYTYTIRLLDPKTRETGKEVFVEAYNIVQAAHKLGMVLNDVIYIYKVIL